MTYDKLKATDKMAVNRGENTYQVPVGDVFTSDKLKDDDQFLVNRGDNSYRISKVDLAKEIGLDNDTTIVTPTMISPVDGAGDMISATSDVITAKSSQGTTILTLASNDPDLAKFTTGDNVQQNDGYDAESDTIDNVSLGPAIVGFYGCIFEPREVGTNSVWVTINRYGDTATTNQGFQVLDADTGQWKEVINGTANPTDNDIKAVLASLGITKISGIAVTGNRGETATQTATCACTRFDIGSFVYRGSDTPIIKEVGYVTQAYPYYTWETFMEGTYPSIGGDYVFQETVLDLSGDKDLDVFQPGDEVQGGSNINGVGSGNQIVVNGGTWSIGDTVQCSYTPATGVVGSTDTGAATMTLASSDETFPKRWITNGTRFVKGEEKPSQDAAPSIDVLFTSSAFASTPENNLTHKTSDWQLTLKADINYASPLDTTTDNAGDLTTWPGHVALTYDTGYRLRVRYKSNTGLYSDWGESVFVTAKFDPNGKVWSDDMTSSTGSFYNGKPKEEAFNGVFDAGENGACDDLLGSSGWVQANFTDIKGQVLLVQTFAYPQYQLEINGTVVRSGGDQGGAARWSDEYTVSGGELTSIRQYGHPTANAGGPLCGIRIDLGDGKGYQLLTDATIRTTPFFDENTGRANAEINLMSQYGVDPTNDPAAAYRVGIYPIIPQADGYGVSHYVKEGSSYRAVAYPYSIAEQHTMDLIREARVAVEDVEDWLDKKKEEG